MKLFDLMKIILVDYTNIMSFFEINCTCIDYELTVHEFKKKYGKDVKFLNRDVDSICAYNDKLFITLK